jgi:hypothetical protein
VSPSAQQVKNAHSLGQAVLAKLSATQPVDAYGTASVALAEFWLGQPPNAAAPRLQQLAAAQLKDGSWSLQTISFPDGCTSDASATALSIAAFLVNGVPHQHPVLTRAESWLSDAERLRQIGPCARYLLWLVGFLRPEQLPDIGLASLDTTWAKLHFPGSIRWHLTAMQLLLQNAKPLPSRLTSLFDRLPNDSRLVQDPGFVDRLRQKATGGETGLLKRAEQYLCSGTDAYWSPTVLPTLAQFALGKLNREQALAQVAVSPWPQLACVSQDVQLALNTNSNPTPWREADETASDQTINPLSKEVPLDLRNPEIIGRILCGPEMADDDRAYLVQELVDTQNTDATWNGRTGLGFLSGTCWALRGLKAAGVDDREYYVLRAGEWFRAMQNADGGWGERPESLSKNSYVSSVSTSAQTAWALLGLLAGGDTDSISVHKGFEFLLANQNSEGLWTQTLETCVGFPGWMHWNDPQQVNAVCVLALQEFLLVGKSR